MLAAVILAGEGGAVLLVTLNGNQYPRQVPPFVFLEETLKQNGGLTSVS